MKELENAILERGRAIGTDILLVDSFLNHQVDVSLMKDVGEEFAKQFADLKIDRVATIESSGIAPAAFTALRLNVPLVIMKKQNSKILTGDLLSTEVISYTKGTKYNLTVKRDFMPEGDSVLFIDDFLASGEAAFGARRVIEQAGAKLAGVGIVIEKSFQPGPQRLREEGIRLCSLAMVSSMADGKIEFKES